MLQLRVAVHLPSLRLPLRAGLARAAAIGAEAVEIDARGELKPRDLTDTAARQLRHLLESHGLRVAAVAFRTRRGYDHPDDLERRVDATKQAMVMAHKLGACLVTNHIGRVPEKEEDPRRGLLLETLADLGRHGLRFGATLAAQTGTESGELLAGLLAALPEGALGVDFDPAELIVHGFSPSACLRPLAGRVLHFRARDAAGEARRTAEMPLGEGSVDFPELLAMLEQQGYRGFVTVERHGGSAPEQDVVQAIRYLRAL